MLALKAERPVKWRWTREEEFLASSTRAPWHIELEDAVTNDGWILGRRMVTLHDSGAYSRFSPYGLTKHAFHHTGAYTIPEPEVRRLRRVHQPRADDGDARVRGDLGVDGGGDAHARGSPTCSGSSPWEIRLKNANRIGDTTGNLVVDAGSLDGAGDAGRPPSGSARSWRAEYRAMSAERRTGELLPEHLVAQQAPEGAHVLDQAGRSTDLTAGQWRRALMAKHTGRGFSTIEYPTG